MLEVDLATLKIKINSWGTLMAETGRVGENTRKSNSMARTCN